MNSQAVMQVPGSNFSMLARARTMVSCTRSSARSGLWASDLANARKLGSAASIASRTSGLMPLGAPFVARRPELAVSRLCASSPDGARPEHTCGTASLGEQSPILRRPGRLLLKPPSCARACRRGAACCPVLGAAPLACGAGPSLGPWQVQNAASRSWARPWDSSGASPTSPDSLRRETALGQMPCQRAVGFPILEADQVIGHDRTSGLRPGGWALVQLLVLAAAHLAQSRVHGIDQGR